MKRYWANDGQPLNDGRLCYVIDLEDGTNPIRTYGQTRDEVFEKITNTTAHAQATIARSARESRSTPAQGTPAPTFQRRLSPEEQMAVTADLSNPAKAPQAIVRLFESQTGLSVEQMQLQRFAEIASAWQQQHPEFYDHPTNQKLLVDNARMRAGGLHNITNQVLEQVYQELQAGGFFIEAAQTTNRTPDVQPEENPAPRTSRPRGATFATSYRANALSGATATAANPRLKYTREQMDRMTLSEQRRLIESRDPEYKRAFDFYFPQPGQATA